MRNNRREEVREYDPQNKIGNADFWVRKYNPWVIIHVMISIINIIIGSLHLREKTSPKRCFVWIFKQKYFWFEQIRNLIQKREIFLLFPYVNVSQTQIILFQKRDHRMQVNILLDRKGLIRVIELVTFISQIDQRKWWMWNEWKICDWIDFHLHFEGRPVLSKCYSLV